MANAKNIKGAGLTGAGLLGGLAGWAAVNRVAVRRHQSGPDDVASDQLEMPEDVTSTTLTVSDGWTVRALQRGPADGQPVILLHGITLSAGIWPYQMADLPAVGFRVIALDLRGHGASTRPDQTPGLEPADPDRTTPGPSADADGPPGSALALEQGPPRADLPPTAKTPSDQTPTIQTPGDQPPAGHADHMSITRLARDVEEVMDQLDLERAILVGHSMGGMVALRMMARDRPTRNGRGRVAGMLLVASSANATRRRGLPGVSEVIALTRPLIARGAGLASHLPGRTLPAYDLAYLLARVTFGNGSSPRQVLWTGEMASHVPVGVSGELLLNIIRFNEEPHLHSIHLPTTVMVGDHDLMTPLLQSEYLARQIRGAELVTLHGCGHMVMLERPKELNEAIVALSERARPRTAARPPGRRAEEAG